MKAAFVLAVAMTLGTAAAARAQTPAPDQSLERMRAVLEHPPLQLTLPEPEANFKIHIEAIHPMHEIFEKPPWQLPPILWHVPAMGPSTAFGSIPILNLDLLSIARSVNAANHSRQERAAHQDVLRTIANYCAAQPNANTIQICSTSAAIR
jgi:hypothetical protein